MASKKTSKKSSTANAAALPSSTAVPEGFKQVGGGYADTWTPEIGDSLICTVVGIIKTVPLKQGRKTTDRRCVEVEEHDTGKRYTIWESATLSNLFDEMDAYEDGPEGLVVYLHFDGLGKKKAGQNPPKLFTVAIQE